MKINVEVDVSPEEARRFLGLPDVTELQEQIMARVQREVEASADPAYLGKLASQMVSGGMQSLELWQRGFLDLMSRSGRNPGKAGDDDPA